MEIKKLISFDFDDTLVHTTLPAEGKKIWKEKTGEDWPHRGWWSKPESLDMEIFDIPLNKKIYRRYKQAISDPDNYVILATGRVAPLQDEVYKILGHYGLSFDETHLNPGIDTFEFKSNLFEKLINKMEPEEFIMYDDRQEHLIRFVEWAKNMPCKVTLIDAISGEEFKPNEDKNLTETIRRVKTLMGLKETVVDIKDTLKVGSKGDGVEEIQKILNIPKDGKYGPQTKGCVKDFQKKQGITDDGIVGPITKKELEKLENGTINWTPTETCKGTTLTKKTEDKTEETKGTTIKNIIIGDSTTPYLDNAIQKASRINKKGGESSLWLGGMSVIWLIGALKKYPVSSNVENVIISMGTNGGFGKYLKYSVSELFELLEKKFPNANFIVVQGAWGFGRLKNIKDDDVKKYYQKYKNEGATIIEPPIGNNEPHGDIPIYKEIARAIDSKL
jgi:FMN phosphatase YigB (HAD superfamily)